MAAAAPRSLRLALFFSVATYSSLQAIIVPVVPEITRHFDSNPAEAGWLISGFLVTGAVTPPIAGRIGDLIGLRRTLVILLAVFVVGIVLALVADSMIMLIVARMMQGFGAATISLGMSIARAAYPPERVSGAIAMISSTMAVNSALGLSLSGPITSLWGFHAVFLLPLVMATAAIVLMLPQVRGDAPRRAGAADVNWWGGVLFVSGLSCALLTITFGDLWGWWAPQTLGILALGLVLLAGWAMGEWRARVPLIDVRLFTIAGVRRASYGTLLFGALGFAAYNIVPIVLTDARLDFELPPAVSGLVMLPISAGTLVVGVLAARIVPVLGYQRIYILCGAINVGIAVVSLFMPGHLWLLIVLLFLHGVSVGMAYASLPALIMLAAPADASGLAAGIYNTMRTVGGAIGAQIMFGIIAASVGAPGTGGFVAAATFLGGLAMLAVIVGLTLPSAGGGRRARGAA
ncbi:MFS transporter [Microbacterium sp. No. 7]|uniref:MFS transporter n=1 Tax=Microbacterium sp. No. 7 TaxID=1714373 RepID=UPI0006D1AEF7|nr:MFS transporter [Microbacterium sp. No. 7]ALJ19265.1 hypothetical protein AOA12_04845 [Microbacterium sp. No. 7]